MRLHVRLALPLLVAAMIVTVMGMAGALWLVSRTFNATLAQEGRQFERIILNALAVRARDLEDVARVLAFVDGPIGGRLAVWNRTTLDGAVILDSRSGRIRSAEGWRPAPEECTALTGTPTGGPPLLRAGGEILLVGTARDRNGRDLVVVSRRLGTEFVDALGDLLQAGVEVGLAGRPVAAGARRGAAGPCVPVRAHWTTPGGATVIFSMALPAGEALTTRLDAVRMTLMAGAGLLLAVVLFYRRLSRLLRETQDRLIHSAQLSTVGQLVAGVSHELNNPLLGVLGHAEYLAGRLRPGDPGEEEVGLILKEGRRMKRQLEELRGFVRPGDAHRGPVDLNALAGEVLGLVRHQAAQAGVTCRLESSPGPAIVRGAPDRVRQALLNLVMNALQAMPTGGVLCVRVGRAEANGRTALRVTVEDTGTGITAPNLARVRDPFFSTSPGRMGLGLAICQDLAVTHGGTLSIDSAPGRGTTVALDLPEHAG